MANPNRISTEYTFSNNGTCYAFNPHYMVHDNLNDGKKMSLLDFHMNLVRHYDSPAVYIIDSRGNIVNPDGTTEPYKRELPKVVKRGNSPNYKGKK